MVDGLPAWHTYTSANKMGKPRILSIKPFGDNYNLVHFAGSNIEGLTKHFAKAKKAHGIS